MHEDSAFPNGQASMEPWFGNHGNECSATAASNTLPLQWSRGSVTTETGSRSRPPTAGSLLLQWSRGSVTTETEECHEDIGDVVGASMEPWFGNHGNPTSLAHRGAQLFASMEPWFGNHGNKTGQVRAAPAFKSFNGAVVR